MRPPTNDTPTLTLGAFRRATEGLPDSHRLICLSLSETGVLFRDFVDLDEISWLWRVEGRPVWEKFVALLLGARAEAPEAL